MIAVYNKKVIAARKKIESLTERIHATGQPVCAIKVFL